MLRLGVAGELARWFETAIAFACLCLCGIETVIAFAGEKWALLVQFSGAEVSSVSSAPCWGRAVGLLVSTPLMFLRPVREICRPARPDAGASTK